MEPAASTAGEHYDSSSHHRPPSPLLTPPVTTPNLDRPEGGDFFDFTTNAPSRRLSGSVLSLQKQYLASQSSASVKSAKLQTHHHQRSFSLARETPSGVATPPRSPTRKLSVEDMPSDSSYVSAAASFDASIPEETEQEANPNIPSHRQVVAAANDTDAEADADADNDPTSKSSASFPFVRALHAFDSSSLVLSEGAGGEDPSSICLSFDEGDVALLHSVHSSGWGDATMLSTGARGWIPTNYFVAYNDGKISALLTAILNFVSHPMSFELAPGVFSFSQASITNVVTGVRSLLEACGTLTRDTPTVKRSQTIRKFRKNLLAELAILVSLAKQYRNSTDDTVIERLINGCYKIAAKAVVFLDIWAIDTNVLDSQQDYVHQKHQPVPKGSMETLATDTRGDRNSSSTVTGFNSTRDSNGSGGSASPKKRPTSNKDLPPDPEHLPVSAATTTAGPNATTLLATIPASASTATIATNSSGTYNGFKRGRDAATANRDSVIFHTLPPTAKQRLDEVNEALTAFLGVFIHRLGYLESDPTASTQILVNTRKSMLACRELLAVVESISAKQQPRSRELEQTKDKLFGQIRGLVTSARDVVANTSPKQQPSQQPPKPEAHDKNSATEEISLAGKKLIESATSCSRTATECVVRCRLILDTVGDFQMPQNREYPDFSDGVIAMPTYKLPARKGSHLMLNLTSTESNFTRLSIVSDMRSPGYPVTPTEQSQGSTTEQSGLLPQIPSLSPIISTPGTMESPIAETTMESDALSRVTSDASLGRSKKSSNSIRSADPQVMDPSAYPIDKQAILDEETGRVRGGSVQVWINMMTDESRSDDAFSLSTFFLTFRLFTTPQEVVACLVTRYEPELDEDELDLKALEDISSRRVKVFNLIKRWMESHWKQSVDGVVLDQILELANTQIVKVLPNAKTMIQELASQLTSGELADGEPIIPRLVSKPDGFAPRSSYNPRAVAPPAVALPSPPSRNLLQLVNKVNNFYGYRTWNSSDPLLPIGGEDRSGSVPTSGESSPSRSRKTSITGGVSTPISDARSIHTTSSAWSSSLRMVRNSTFNGAATGVAVTDFDPMEIAAQLTLMDSDMFCKLEPAELIVRNFDKKRSAGRSPRVAMMATYMNQFSSFVGNTVLQADLQLKQRKNVLKFWIKVADKCLEMRNYNSLMGIMSALQSVNIIRLKRTWDTLSPRYHALFNRLKEISSPERNFASYRQRIRNQTAPAIPFLGVYLSDLTFLVEGNVKTRKFSIPGEENKVISVINYDLYQRIAKLICEVQKFQVPYKLPAGKGIQTWLRGEMIRAHEEVSKGDELWRRSCIVEPKET